METLTTIFCTRAIPFLHIFLWFVLLELGMIQNWNKRNLWWMYGVERNNKIWKMQSRRLIWTDSTIWFSQFGLKIQLWTQKMCPINTNWFLSYTVLRKTSLIWHTADLSILKLKSCCLVGARLSIAQLTNLVWTCIE